MIEREHMRRNVSRSLNFLEFFYIYSLQKYRMSIKRELIDLAFIAKCKFTIKRSLIIRFITNTKLIDVFIFKAHTTIANDVVENCDWRKVFFLAHKDKLTTHVCAVVSFLSTHKLIKYSQLLLNFPCFFIIIIAYK